MSSRVAGKALKSNIALAVVLSSAVTLSGCSSVGFMRDNTTTGSTSMFKAGPSNQPMPTVLGNSGKTAEGPYTPPNDIGGEGTQAAALMPVNSGGVINSDLPVLAPSSESTAMSAQPNLAPVTVGPKPAALGSTPASAPIAANDGTYYHTIAGGESLYSIAKRYNVTAQAIIQANGFSSPDKIFVGQKLIIPGQSAPKTVVASTAPLSGDEPTQSPIATPTPKPVTTAAIADPKVLESNVAPPAAQPKEQVASIEPKMSGSDKFRWPVSGKVIADFGQSKGTGINIEAPEGSPVRAAENGTVIYVGSGVEGYGNLILIRHPNGYVSAYAHLKAMSVTKGQNVNRGDNIGQTGMTGSVNRPQLHFELRKGATPVDPMPLLAS